jgi:dTDP-glucose pyrophosphorylase
MKRRVKSWQEVLVSCNQTIKDVIEILNHTGLKIVLVSNEDKELLGTITDGDIRRGLINGLTLNTSVKEILNSNPIVVDASVGKEAILELMTLKQIQQIPIVNEKRQVIGLHIFEELDTPVGIPNLMVIMAGGKGTRLRPNTEHCPKPMLPIAGKPILEHIINRAKKQGISKFIITLNYLGHMIENYFEDGKNFGVNISYIRENSPLGTAGALSLIENTSDFTLIISNGDVISDISYVELLDFHKRNNSFATMAVWNHEWQNPYGVVQTRGFEIIGYEEKPVVKNYINAGVYALESNVLSFLKREEHCDMPTLLDRLQKNSNRVIVFPMHEPWMDIGNPLDLEKANEISNLD